MLREGVDMAQPGPAILVAGSVGLDFLNSIATPIDQPVDWIGDGDGLLAWLRQTRLVPPEILDGFKKNTLPGELDAVAAQARALREWFRSFLAKRKGRSLSADDITYLDVLNGLLARDQSFLRIDLLPIREEPSASPRPEVRWVRRWSSPESLLQPIAEALAHLVCDEDLSHVKACEGVSCTLLFADHTKGHRRRWCSMAICGNRAKQVAHYRRRHSRG
jgi:predicted RNA-binding Zn ribbon-like protein